MSSFNLFIIKSSISWPPKLFKYTESINITLLNIFFAIDLTKENILLR